MLNGGHTEQSLGRANNDGREAALKIAGDIFDVIKKIPGGAVERKINEVGERAVWAYFRNTYMWSKGYHQYGLPSKGVRKRFFAKRNANLDAPLGVSLVELAEF